MIASTGGVCYFEDTDSLKKEERNAVTYLQKFSVEYRQVLNINDVTESKYSYGLVFTNKIVPD